jgi:hypothetical protein
MRCFKTSPDWLPRLHVADFYTSQFSADLPEPRVVQYRRRFVRHWHLWRRKSRLFGIKTDPLTFRLGQNDHVCLFPLIRRRLAGSS